MDKLNELVEMANKMGGESWCYTQSSIFSKGYITGTGGRTIVQTYNGDVPANACQFIRTADPAAILEIAEAFRDLERRAEAAEAQLAELPKQNHPKAVVKHYTGCKYPVIKINSLEVVIAGEREDAEELAEYVNSIRPAPTAVPVDVVPPEADGSNLPFAANGWNACRAEVLRRIEEMKK